MGDGPEPRSDDGPASGSPSSHHVRLALDGDRQSLSWIVTRFSPLLTAQAAWRLGPRLRFQVDPEDVVAEAWLVALRRLSDLDRAGGRTTPRLLAFLGTTILHIVNHRIDEAVLRRRRMAPPGATGDDESDRMNEIEATVTGAVTNASRTELAATLEACLASLASKDREIILLRIVEGRSNDDAARDLGEAPNTVSHRYQRALAKMREALPRAFVDELEE